MLPRPHRHDLLLAAVLFSWAELEVWLGHLDGSPVVNALAAALVTAPLARRRSSPLVVGIVCAGGIALKTAVGAPNEGLAINLGLLVAAYSVGRQRPPRWAAVVVAAMVVLAWLSLLGLPPVDQSFSNYPFIAVWLGGPAVAGAVLRVQLDRTARLAAEAARAELLRDQHAHEAVAAERGRIARELHDTVAHAVSVMVLQAGAVRSRLPGHLAAERDALDSTADTGRRAIEELRRLLGVLRDDGSLPETEPQPTLAQLDRLLDDARGAGLQVDLSVEGDRRPLDPAVEVTAYRILQEALTNVRRHARARSVAVQLGYRPDRLCLQVCDDGVGVPETEPAGTAGWGLVGMRERVEVYGGTLLVGTPDGGRGCAVDATLPLVRTVT
jgi:signal transduction histidine kinase